MTPAASRPIADDSPMRSGRRIAAVSVGVNLVLAVAALWAGLAGSSTTVLSAGVEFAADVAASLVVMAGFWYASKPADVNHPYGHGRAETLTGLVVGLALLLVGAALVARGLALYAPDRFAAADAVGGVLVGIFVITAGVGIVRSTSLDLIDTMPPPAVVEQVRQAALSVPGVRGVEKCVGRKTGLQYHMDLHLEVDGWISVDEGHAIAARTREAVTQQVPEVTDVLVHVEPMPS